ncbi:MAG: hypothetical protein ACKOXF_00265 [Chitinophagaceae bacterium]
MLIEVKSDMMLKDLKKQFHSYYPNLKIEFFNQTSSESGRNTKAQMLENDTLLSTLISDREGSVEFRGDTSVRQFETLFSETFGLNVQVFRKSGNVYLETSNTDDWTLDMEHKEAVSSMVRGEGATSDFTDRDQWE